MPLKRHPLELGKKLDQVSGLVFEVEVEVGSQRGEQELPQSPDFEPCKVCGVTRRRRVRVSSAAEAAEVSRQCAEVGSSQDWQIASLAA